MVLGVMPTCVNHLIAVGGGVERAVTQAVIGAIVAVVIKPISPAVRPVDSISLIANIALGRRDAGRGRFWTGFIGDIAGKDDHKAVRLVVNGVGVVEQGFF